MKNIFKILSLLLLINSLSFAQTRLIDRSGTVRFFSSAPMEDIEAINQSALGIIELPSGEVAVSILIKGFQFEKALMQEHFNENYMESDKFSKATFIGKIENPEKLQENGKFQADIKGKMTVHGVTKEITMKAEIEVTSDAILVESKFNLTVADYKIEIPKLVRNNIAKEVEVTANFNLTGHE
ncbi:YceI family protein [Roseivirga sp.]|uniref:YceI family protein n=1 Tax=Roseivirga sp. TaxID=1964215 RepID=UPI003B51E2ED